MATERFDVVVVGAGWNGLIGAKTYLDFRPDARLVLLDDQASIGGVWNKEKIYPSLYAQIKFGLFEYSFYPMRREGITADGYIPGETINTYLNEFARDHGLARRTRLLNKVVKVDRPSPNGLWRLEIEGKPPIETDKLIYASGATSHPVLASWPKSSDFDVPVIHSSETGTHLNALSSIRSAVVVGAAKSAYDTVFLLLQNGVKVNWIIREDGSGPMALMPPTIMGLVNSMDAISTRAMAMLGSSIMNTKGVANHLLQRTVLGRAATNAFWKTITWIAEMHAGYSKSPNARKLRPLPCGNGIFWANAGLGCASVPNFWKVFHAGDCKVHLTEIESLAHRDIVRLRNGSCFATDYIVLCTGFDKSYQTFSPEAQRACGLTADPGDAQKWAELDVRAEEVVDTLLPALKNPPIPASLHEKLRDSSTPDHQGAQQSPLHGPSRHYRRLVVPSLAARGDQSVYFPGFIHSIYTPLVSEVQALWGVSFLLGLNEVPAQDEMEREVSEWNMWCRKRYLAQGRKHAYAIFDFLSYIDMMLADLGVNTTRSTNPFAELFLPAYPRMYRGLIDEFRAAYAKRYGVEVTDMLTEHSVPMVMGGDESNSSASSQ
ncbi:hypothetical protein PG985_008463 [Apiospora marii]|uniref:Uncharacterized protein n=1 Tax=Apiospora marii TaxID=335849 RepID=A0ABR1STG4_9PEZI